MENCKVLGAKSYLCEELREGIVMHDEFVSHVCLILQPISPKFLVLTVVWKIVINSKHVGHVCSLHYLQAFASIIVWGKFEAENVTLKTSPFSQAGLHYFESWTVHGIMTILYENKCSFLCHKDCPCIYVVMQSKRFLVRKAVNVSSCE
jgi:hypothetical protein